MNTINCRDCAYHDKQDKVMWCRFHDEQVQENNYCDYYLNYFDSPEQKAAIEAIKNGSMFNSEAHEPEAAEPVYPVPAEAQRKDKTTFIQAIICISVAVAFNIFWGLCMIFA